MEAAEFSVVHHELVPIIRPIGVTMPGVPAAPILRVQRVAMNTMYILVQSCDMCTCILSETSKDHIDPLYMNICVK